MWAELQGHLDLGFLSRFARLASSAACPSQLAAEMPRELDLVPGGRSVSRTRLGSVLQSAAFPEGAPLARCPAKKPPPAASEPKASFWQSRLCACEEVFPHTFRGWTNPAPKEKEKNQQDLPMTLGCKSSQKKGRLELNVTRPPFLTAIPMPLKGVSRGIPPPSSPRRQWEKRRFNGVAKPKAARGFGEL